MCQPALEKDAGVNSDNNAFYLSDLKLNEYRLLYK